MLLLKKHLVELVRAGKKTQTIRLWSRALVQPGKLSYTPGLGRVRITSVEEVAAWEALTEADAVADGFTDRAALLAELRRLYGAAVPPGRHIYRIKFQYPVLPEGEVVIAPVVTITEKRSDDSAAERVESVALTPPVTQMVADENREIGDPIHGANPELLGTGAATDADVLPRRDGKLMSAEQREKLRAFVIERGNVLRAGVH